MLPTLRKARRVGQPLLGYIPDLHRKGGPAPFTFSGLHSGPRTDVSLRFVLPTLRKARRVGQPLWGTFQDYTGRSLKREYSDNLRRAELNGAFVFLRQPLYRSHLLTTLSILSIARTKRQARERRNTFTTNAPTITKISMMRSLLVMWAAPDYRPVGPHNRGLGE